MLKYNTPDFNRWLCAKLKSTEIKHTFLVSEENYDPINPLDGWTPPDQPVLRDTVSVSFGDGVVANYTYTKNEETNENEWQVTYVNPVITIEGDGNIDISEEDGVYTIRAKVLFFEESEFGFGDGFYPASIGMDGDKVILKSTDGVIGYFHYEEENNWVLDYYDLSAISNKTEITSEDDSIDITSEVDMNNNTIYDLSVNPSTITTATTFLSSPTFPVSPKINDTYINKYGSWVYNGSWILQSIFEKDFKIELITEKNWAIADDLSIKNILKISQLKSENLSTSGCYLKIFLSNAAGVANNINQISETVSIRNNIYTSSNDKITNIENFPTGDFLTIAPNYFTINIHFIKSLSGNNSQGVETYTVYFYSSTNELLYAFNTKNNLYGVSDSDFIKNYPTILTPTKVLSFTTATLIGAGLDATDIGKIFFDTTLNKFVGWDGITFQILSN